MERHKGAEMARALDDERGGLPKITVYSALIYPLAGSHVTLQPRAIMMPVRSGKPWAVKDPSNPQPPLLMLMLPRRVACSA
jgi:hypothetical protein